MSAYALNCAQKRAYALNYGKECTMSKVWLVTGCSRGLGHAIADAVLAPATLPDFPQ